MLTGRVRRGESTDVVRAQFNAVTCALLGARTMSHLDDLLAGVDSVLSDDILDRIDEIVPPGSEVGALDQAYVPPAIAQASLRRRSLSARAAA